jgi:hypothetical protein
VHPRLRTTYVACASRSRQAAFQCFNRITSRWFRLATARRRCSRHSGGVRPHEQMSTLRGKSERDPTSHNDSPSSISVRCLWRSFGAPTTAQHSGRTANAVSRVRLRFLNCPEIWLGRRRGGFRWALYGHRVRHARAHASHGSNISCRLGSTNCCTRPR